MKKILDVNLDHYGAYPAMSHALSILKSNMMCDTWIYNNFLQIFSVEKLEDHVVDFFDFNIENTPYLDFNTIEKGWILEHLSIHEFLASIIERGYYIICFVNTEFIKAYNYIAGSHDPMIYGYDDNEKIYYLCDHINGGKYTSFTCTFREVEEALLYSIEVPERYRSRNQKEVDVFRIVNFDEFWHKDKLQIYYDYDKRNSLYLDKIISSLNDFLNAQETTCWGNRINFMSEQEKKCHRFGIDCYIDIEDHIERMWEFFCYSKDSIQTLYVFYAYVGIMMRRISKMKKYLYNIDSHMEQWNLFFHSFSLFQKKFLLEVCRNSYRLSAKAELTEQIRNLKNTHIILTENLLNDFCKF